MLPIIPNPFAKPARSLRPGRFYYLFGLLFLLWTFQAAAVSVSQQTVLIGDLQQPVAIAKNAQGHTAVLDAQGLAINRQQTTVPRTALDVFASESGWWVAEPKSRHLLQLNANGGVIKSFEARQLQPAPVGAGLVPAPNAGQPQGNAGQPQGIAPTEPEPVAVAVYQNVLYWSDRANHRVCLYDLQKQTPLTCVGKRGEAESEFQYPYQMAFDRDGYLHVVDILNARIQMFDRSGRFFNQIGQFGTAAGKLFRPNGIAIDIAHDLVFVSDSYFGTIKVFKAGEALGELTTRDGKVIQLNSPTGLAWQNGQLLVAETGANRITALTIADDAPTANKPASTEKPASGDAWQPENELSQKNCLSCHLSWAKQRNQPDAQGMLPESSTAMCYSCHNGAVMDSRFSIGQGAQHATVYDSQTLKDKRKSHQRKDKLPDEFPHTNDKQLPCTACHTPHTQGEEHETLYEGHKNAWLRVPNKGGDLCERCHESKAKHARELDPKQRGVNHPLGIHFAKPPAPNAQGFASEDKLHQGLPEKLRDNGGVLGHEQTLICQSCHQVHGGHGERSLTVLTDDKAALCATCHFRQFSDGKKEARHKGVHPVNVKPDKPMKYRDKPVDAVTCQTCHKIHDGELGTALLQEGIKSSNAPCAECHKRQDVEGNRTDSDNARQQTIAKAVKKGVHPVNLTLKEAVDIGGQKVRELTCLTCHSVHNGKADTPLLEKNLKTADALCQTCHQRQHVEGNMSNNDEARQQTIVKSLKKGVHPTNLTLKEPVKIGENEKTRELKCLTCHAVHNGKPDTPALVEDHRDGQLCRHCHAGKQAVVGSDHDLRLTAKDKPNHVKELPQTGVCGACHTLHRGENQPAHLYAAKVIAEDRSDPDMQYSDLQEDKLCINCHQKGGVGEKKVVKFFSHPHKDITLRSKTSVMPLFKTGKTAEFGEIACLTCHEPHFWDADQLRQSRQQPQDVKPTGYSKNVEGTPINSFLRTKGVKDTFCVECHGLEGLTKFKYFHDKDMVRNIGVDYLQ